MASLHNRKKISRDMPIWDVMITRYLEQFNPFLAGQKAE
jgi:hypothetical protein